MINDKWSLRSTISAVKRYICDDINKHSIKRLQIEFEYALAKLKQLEAELCQSETRS